jgi:hypothetical protein
MDDKENNSLGRRKSFIFLLITIVVFFFGVISISRCSQQGSSAKKAPDGPTLKYTIVKKTDITFPVNNPRWVFRVILNTDIKPSEELIKNTASYIWKNDYYSSMGELTIFMYLPGMDTEGGSYSLAVFDDKSCKEFKVLQ